MKQTFADHRVVFVVDDFDVVRLMGGGMLRPLLRHKRGGWRGSTVCGWRGVELNADPK